MAHSSELEAFLEESRKIRMADVKALEAAMDHAASFLPESANDALARSLIVDLLTIGQDYLRAEMQIQRDAEEGDRNGH